jgi:hypothetical protein
VGAALAANAVLVRAMKPGAALRLQETTNVGHVPGAHSVALRVETIVLEGNALHALHCDGLGRQVLQDVLRSWLPLGAVHLEQRLQLGGRGDDVARHREGEQRKHGEPRRYPHDWLG